MRRVVAESARLAALEPKVDCLPFHWPYYDDDCDAATKPMFPGGRIPLPAALQTMALTESYEAGADGVILWVRHMAVATGACLPAWRMHNQTQPFPPPIRQIAPLTAEVLVCILCMCRAVAKRIMFRGHPR